MHILLEQEINKEYQPSKWFSVELKKFKGLSHLIRMAEDLSDFDLYHQSYDYLTQNILKNCSDDVINDHVKKLTDKNIPVWSNILHERVHRGEEGLLVSFKEKHGDYIYDISEPELFQNTFITELNDNYKLGCYLDLVDGKEIDKEELSQLNLFKKEVITDKEKVEGILSQLNQDNPCLPVITKKAFTFMEKRSSLEHQYETFDIFTPIKMTKNFILNKNLNPSI